MARIALPDTAFSKQPTGKHSKPVKDKSYLACQTEHDRQHRMNERKYWQSVGIDPCLVALALYGAYPNTHLAIMVIQNARKSVLRPASQNPEIRDAE
jgi:hypothetical protein